MVPAVADEGGFIVPTWGGSRDGVMPPAAIRRWDGGGIETVAVAGASATGGTVVTGSAVQSLDGSGRDDEEEPGVGRARTGPRRRWLVGSVVFAGYVALALLMFHDAWADLGTVTFGGGDAVLFSWYLAWTPHAVATGLDPFVTHHINAPDGTNILWSTGVPLLALLVAPVTAAAGPVTAFTVLLTAAPAVSGWAMFLAARRWTGAFPSAVAGLLYGFSPYLVGGSYGHLHLTFVPFPPLLLLLLDDLFVRRRRPWRTGALLGLAVAAQAMVSEEVLATSAIVSAVGLAILAFRYRERVRAHLPDALRGLAACTAVASVLLAWPLAVQMFGAQRVHGTIQPPDIAVSDLFTFVTPTPLQAFGPDFAVRESLTFTGNAVEVSGYLGVPLLVLLAAIWFRRRADPLVGLFGPLFVAVAVLSLGPRLHVAGRTTGIPMPWVVFEQLPLLGSALPSRLSLFGVLAVAMVFAVWLDAVWRGAFRGRQVSPMSPPAASAGIRLLRRYRPVGVVVLTAAVLVPLVPASMVGFTVATPAFFTGGSLAAWVAPGATALVAPYPHPEQDIAMLWQAEADFRYRMVGCYCTVPGPDGRANFHAAPDPLNSALVAVQDGRVGAAEALAAPGVRETFTAYRPDVVILGPTGHRAELEDFLAGLVGSAGTPVDGVVVWRLG